MTKRKDQKSPSHGDYDVGYGKPPTHSRFRPGRSGNPAGRRKGVRNLKTDVTRTLAAPIRVNEDGRMRTKSTQEGALLLLREKALRGDTRSLERLVELAIRFNNDEVEAASSQPLSADDQAILDAYVADTANLTPSPNPPPPRKPGRKKAK